MGFSTGTARALPLSQVAIVHGGTIYCSGTGPLDPETRTDRLSTTSPRTRSVQTLANLVAVVEAVGGGRGDRSLKCTCFVADVANFQATFNAVYRGSSSRANPHFPAQDPTIDRRPAHCTGVQVEVGASCRPG